MSELIHQPLKYEEIPDVLSARQLAEHHGKLYAGYVKKAISIRERLATTDSADANATHSDWRELKVEETFAVNGVVLHERYFAGLKPGGSEPSERLRILLERDFGSYAQWAENFMACGLAARGWVILAYDLNDGKLHNYLCDLHNQGGVWGACPLLVLDVYEHAYFLDYATDRASYLKAYLANLDWSVAEAVLERHGLAA